MLQKRLRMMQPNERTHRLVAFTILVILCIDIFPCVSFSLVSPGKSSAPGNHLVDLTQMILRWIQNHLTCSEMSLQESEAKADPDSESRLFKRPVRSCSTGFTS